MYYIFHGLAAICKSFAHENLGISVYNGQPNDDVMHRKMELKFLKIGTAGKLHSLTLLVNSFATMRFVLAGCGVCIPSFSVCKHGSMPDLEKVVLHSMVAAASQNADKS